MKKIIRERVGSLYAAFKTQYYKDLCNMSCTVAGWILMEAYGTLRAVNICFSFKALFLPASVVHSILREWVFQRGSFAAYGLMQTVSHYGPNKIELKDVNICLHQCTVFQFPHTCYSNSSTCLWYKLLFSHL